MEVPGVGRVPKTYVYGATAVAAGYVLYAYMKRSRDRKAAAAAAASAGPNTDYGTPDVLPAVPPGAHGAFGPVNGNSTTPPPANAITDNATWSAAVRDRMAGAYPDNLVVDAIGAFLNKQPLNDQQLKIVQAAIAVAGYPPVGDLHVISGPTGSTAMLVAPTNVHVIDQQPDQFTIVFDPVPGAESYIVWEEGVETARFGPQPVCGVPNRAPGTTYGPFEFAAVSASGQVGPKSAGQKFSTAPAAGGSGDGGAAPSPAPAAPAAPSAPAPAAPSYPTYWFSHTNQHDDSYASIAQRYGLNISGDELYQYQFSPEAGRPASTQATLRARGYTIYAGGETEIPYPRR
ncbi:hypothetical protein AB0D63_43300 [Kitasatospora sp. NPDC048343]|uniref:hypothetical protein n=1 Tax=Kitasatospora sp. NPDC048343 TaxID=3154717 RepID=UPI0033DF41AA